MSTFILKRYGFRCCVDDGQAQEQDSVMSVIIRNEISFFMIPIPMFQIGQKFILEHYPLFNPISIPFCESER